MCFFFQAEDGIRDLTVTGVQTCALPISVRALRFTVGGLEPAAPPAPTPQGRSATPLPAADRHAIDAATSVISDPTLAAVARRLPTKARPSSAERGAGRWPVRRLPQPPPSWRARRPPRAP